MAQAIVVGGGPAGLAVAATLKEVGLSVRVLERSARVGDSWRAHYDRLRLHTARRLSSLPGLPIPAAYGPWVRRDDFVAYQEAYAQHHALAIEHGVTVRKVARAGDGWQVTSAAGEERADLVVIATGYNHAPLVPEWASTGGFAGEIVHTCHYKNPAPFAGRRVLVVGSGNSGAEIAQDLAEHGVDVAISIRTVPTVLPRALAGVPTQAIGILLRPLPAALVDTMMIPFTRLVTGDLRRYGMPAPPRHGYARFLATGVTPVLDVGFVAQLKAGKLKIVPAVEGLSGGEALLAGGARLPVDVILLATGYRRGLDALVGHLGLVDGRGLPVVHGGQTHPDHPGLYFIGFSNPISGNFREIALDARRIARHVARARRRLPATRQPGLSPGGPPDTR